MYALFIIFTVVPIIELALLIKVGGLIGTWNTVFLVMATAVAGAYMVRMEGLSVFYRLQDNLARGVFPADELLDGGMILVAGALLLTPGFFTDVLGFVLVFPLSRSLVRKRVKAYLRRRVQFRHFGDPGPDA